MEPCRFCVLLLLLFGVGAAAEEAGEDAIPAGTVLQIRLRQTVSSYVTKAGTAVLAEVIAPVEVNGRTLLPFRTELIGYVKEARRVGLGFSRETALLHLEFDRIQFPGKAERPIAGMVSRLDDARERVDGQGRIRGIRASDSFSSMLAGFAVSAGAFDPMALIFSLSSSLSVFRLPDSSVVLPAGTELRFRVGANLKVEEVFGEQYPALGGGNRAELEGVVKELPFRTATKTDGTLSDLTSLLYLGSQEAIERAFEAAGWVRSDKLDGKSSYGVMRSIVENQGYRTAPMSVLVLNGKEPELAFAKTLNTFFSRHHLRIYSQPTMVDGKAVWTSTATYDSGIGFSKGAKTFIHLINENIDEERSKVVNDLLLTGCVDGVGYVERPWVPRDAKNSTGDTLRTDGRIAVLRMNDCVKPRRADEEDVMRRNVKLQQSAYVRPLRSTILTLRNDLLRGNMAYQAFHGIRTAKDILGKPKAADAEQPKSFRYGGQEFLIVDGAKPMVHREVPKDAGHKVKMRGEETAVKNYSSKLSFSLSGGLTGFGGSTVTTLPTTVVVNSGGQVIRDPLRFDSTLERGWTLSPKITMNTWKYVSNEFAYTRSQTNFRLVGKDELTGMGLDSRSKAAVRTFTYNTVVHLTPNGRRVRPYVAAGPAVQLIHLLDARPETNGLLKFAARDVALFVTAYNFGSKPALDGGGVFQFGLNYGGGVKVHVTPRLFMRVDFRETVTRKPDFWKSLPQRLKESTDTEVLRLEYGPVVRGGALRHQVVTMGIGVAF